MSDLSICQVRKVDHQVVTTKCGATTTLAHATGWASMVTCRFCIAGERQPLPADDYAASFAALAPLATDPAIAPAQRGRR